jgi:hypothetical protein
MEKEANKELGTFDGLPVKEAASIEDMVGALDTGLVTSVMSVSFTRSGTEILYDYGIPSAYNAYAIERPQSPSAYMHEPWMRHGADNQFPFFVLRLSQEAASHRSAYSRAAATARGSGVTIQGDDAGLVATWLKSVGVNHSFLSSITEAQALFGGFYTRYDFNFSAAPIDGVRAALRRVFILPFHDTRPGKRGHNVGQGRIWQADSFVRTARRASTAAKVVGYPVLPADPSEISLDVPVVDVSGSPVSADLVAASGVFAHFQMIPGLASPDFPTPAWMSNTAVNAINMEGAISQFDLASLENGLTASYMVSIPFAETQTEKRDKKGEERKRKVVERFTREYSGPLNAGRAMVFFTDPRKGANEISIKEIPSDNKADLQKVLQERKDRSIVTAWQAPDERLIGMPPLANKGLSSQENALSGAEDLWYTSFIHPVIVTPVEDWFNNVLLPLCPFFDPLTMRASLIRKSLVSRAMSDNVMLSILSIDEMRALYGFAPLDETQAAEVKSRQIRTTGTRNRNN